LAVAILTGSEGNFCAGADLKALASGSPGKANPVSTEGIGPMGSSRMQLSKPVIAAIDGYCVDGNMNRRFFRTTALAADVLGSIGIGTRIFPASAADPQQGSESFSAVLEPE
jgi:1,4-dihydroxy-2-naphthoyl-CoA synthase